MLSMHSTTQNLNKFTSGYKIPARDNQRNAKCVASVFAREQLMHHTYTRVKGLHQKTKNVQGMQRLQVALAYRN